MTAALALTNCLERRGFRLVFTTAVRFRSEKKGRKKIYQVKTVDKGQYVKAHNKKGKQLEQETRKSDEKTTYLGEKPVDDVWISKYYPQPKYDLREIIKRHQEYAQPAMFDSLDSKIYADMELNMQTKKQSRFLQSIKNTVSVPHVFETGVKNRCVVICQGQEEIEQAYELGALKAGGDDIVKMLKDGVLKQTDFDYVLATPAFTNALVSLRGILRNSTPSVSAGTVDESIEKMLNYFLNGLTYESYKISDAVGKLQIPFGTLEMPVEWLEENFHVCISDILQKAPIPGSFITHLSIVAPPSPERFILNPEEYVLEKKESKKEKTEGENDDIKSEAVQ